MEKGKKKN